MRTSLSPCRLSLAWVLACTLLVRVHGQVATPNGLEQKLNPTARQALHALPGARLLQVGIGGSASFLAGDLGRLEVGSPSSPAGSKLLLVESISVTAKAGGVTAAQPVLLPEALTGLLGVKNQDLKLQRRETDPVTRTVQLRYAQTKNKLRVFGGEINLQVNADHQCLFAQGLGLAERELEFRPKITGPRADELARRAVGGEASKVSVPELLYLVTSTTGETRLCYLVEVTASKAAQRVAERVFIDALSGEVVEKHGLIASAVAQTSYDARGLEELPPEPDVVLRRSEATPASGIGAVDTCYDQTALCGVFLLQRFGRDSLNGQGGRINSTVNFGTNVCNAGWDIQSSQVFYGSGNGVGFSDLAKDPDVVVHELTHGLTQATSDLAYANEAGALNEGFSDIMTAVFKQWRFALPPDSPRLWHVGQDCFTPAIPDDALRYMDDPARDQVSRDYFPACTFNPADDFGEVHRNSGVVNLCFKLLVTGGTHPRGRSAVVVAGIGMEKAANIFYAAFTGYLGRTARFADARLATVQVAQSRYGAAEAAEVAKAWSAVGVD